MPERQLKTVRASIARAPKPKATGGYRYSGTKAADTRPTAEQQLREAAEGLRLLQRDQSAPASAPEPAVNWPVDPEPRTAAIGGAPEPQPAFGTPSDQHAPRVSEGGVPTPPSIWDDHT